MKRFGLLLICALLLTGCWTPNHRDANGNEVRWPAKVLLVSINGTEWQQQLVRQATSEITVHGGYCRHFQQVAVGDPAADIRVDFSWPTEAQWSPGWTGQQWTGATYTRANVLINPGYWSPVHNADWQQRSLGTVRHEMGHAVGLGHSTGAGADVELMSGTVNNTEWTANDIEGLKAMAC